jgi:predicted GNAT family acetyltransferase
LVGDDDHVAEVKDNPDKSRFEISLDGECIGVMTYRVVGDTVVAPHTLIERRYGGRGYGGELVRGALDRIRAAGLYVDPQCSFVRAFIAKTPEYHDLVKES